jgi:transposase
VRAIGLEVHRDFCEVAISEDGRTRSAGRVQTTPQQLQLFAQSLASTDRVVLEATGNALAIARILEPHVSKVVLANSKKVRVIAEAKVKTDKIDARVLAELLAAGYIPEVWVGDERTRALRRHVSRRRGLVKRRTALKNEISSVLVRNLKRRPVSDPFGARGRDWLAQLDLPADERETVEACLRQLDFLQGELELVERRIAEHAVDSPEIRRLMTIPGIDVTAAAALMAAVGDIHRFPTPRHLVGYLGLHPSIRQSGSARARHGRTTKQGSAAARQAPTEAAWAATKAPGPLRAFGQRIAARRGPTIAAVAIARKLAVLAWHLLTREQDYAFQRPGSLQRKLRRLELRAGTPRSKTRPAPRPQPLDTRPRPAGNSSRPPSRDRLQATRQRLAGNQTIHKRTPQPSSSLTFIGSTASRRSHAAGTTPSPTRRRATRQPRSPATAAP